MIRPLKVRGLTLGDGIPKICVPLTPSSMEELQSQIAQMTPGTYDLVEWRLDYLPPDVDYAEMYRQIRGRLMDTPLLATFRTAGEGGQRAISAADYHSLYEELLNLGVDLIDLEWRLGESVYHPLLESARLHGAHAIFSYPDFQKTPSKEEILRILTAMQASGADLVKIALMPHCLEDVLTLLSASDEMFRLHAHCPLITMSMGRLGMISRLCGAYSGSAVTFGACGASSAPGQPDAALLRSILSSVNPC